MGDMSGSWLGRHSLTQLAIPAKTQHVTSALHVAAINGDKPAIVKLISSSHDARATADSPDSFGRTPLMYAVLGGRLDSAELLLKAGCNINAKDNARRTALHWAAHKENHKFFKLLFNRGCDFRAKDMEGLTAFHLCMKHRTPKSASLLIKALNANEIEEQDNFKRTALHIAAMYGSHEQVQLLLSRDANVGIPDGAGKTPLHWAINSKNQYSGQIVQQLIDNMPSVINWQDHDGRTSLHLAVAEGSYNLVKTLISNESCKLACLDNNFRTPLHWAAVLGHTQIVELLLNKGCDWTCSDANGATPLHYAAQKNHSETVKAFLQFPELTDVADIEGRTALMWAAGSGSTETLSTFLTFSPDLTQTDKNGATALHAASASGSASCVKVLLEAKCAISADNMKLTPLARAAEMGHVPVAQLLIKFGAKVTHQDQQGRFPLHWAALGGSPKMCELLLQSHNDANCSDYFGRTPLQYAAQKGFNNCMSKLIDFLADPNLQDAQGRTALHWSCSLGHLDAAKLLIKSGSFPNHMEFTEERYTPLDYALLNNHQEVVQYLLEHGALSINGIRDLAAAKIQAAFKGLRERRSFNERRTLLLKHDQLRKKRNSHLGDLQPLIAERIHTLAEERSVPPFKMPFSDESPSNQEDNPPLEQDKSPPEPKDQTPPEQVKMSDEDKPDSSSTAASTSKSSSTASKTSSLKSSSSKSSSTSESEKEGKFNIAEPTKDMENQKRRSRKVAHFEDQTERKNDAVSVSSQHSNMTGEANQGEASGASRPSSSMSSSSSTSGSASLSSRISGKPLGLAVSQSTPKPPKAEPSESEEAEAQRAVSPIGVRNATESVVPFDITADESRRRSSSVSSYTPRRQLDFTNTNFSLSDEDVTAVQSSDDSCALAGGVAGSPMMDGSFDEVMERQSEFRRLRVAEQRRRAEIHRRNHAAAVIQKAWRAYGFKSKKFYKAFKEVIHKRRTLKQEQTLKKEVAALTIQLAWRRYYRRKILRTSNPYKMLVNKYSVKVRLQKQNFLESRIYSEKESLRHSPHYNPLLHTLQQPGPGGLPVNHFYGVTPPKPKRPFYFRSVISQSAADYNFALNNYHPTRYAYGGVAPKRIHSGKRYSYNMRA